MKPMRICVLNLSVPRVRDQQGEQRLMLLILTRKLYPTSILFHRVLKFIIAIKADDHNHSRPVAVHGLMNPHPVTACIHACHRSDPIGMHAYAVTPCTAKGLL